MSNVDIRDFYVNKLKPVDTGTKPNAKSDDFLIVIDKNRPIERNVKSDNKIKHVYITGE